jgi:hypothetical protein
VLHGFILPHAPVLLIDHGYEDVVEFARTTRGIVKELLPRDLDLVVLVSPHGADTGVYKKAAGSLHDFGLSGYAIDVPRGSTDAAGVADAWNRPTLDLRADHGVVVPYLLLGSPNVSVVAATFREITGPDETAGADLDAAEALAKVLAELSTGMNVAVVVSAHTAAALSPRAPLLDRREGHLLHGQVRDALLGDVAELDRIEGDLWMAGGSCGVAPFAVAARLWAGTAARILAEGSPAGVGYIVAEFRPQP